MTVKQFIKKLQKLPSNAEVLLDNDFPRYVELGSPSLMDVYYMPDDGEWYPKDYENSPELERWVSGHGASEKAVILEEQ